MCTRQDDSFHTSIKAILSRNWFLQEQVNRLCSVVTRHGNGVRNKSVINRVQAKLTAKEGWEGKPVLYNNVGVGGDKGRLLIVSSGNRRSLSPSSWVDESP